MSVSWDLLQNRQTHVCKLLIKITAQDEAGGGGAEALWSGSALWTLHYGLWISVH